MTAGSGVRGCAATASVTMTPSTGAMTGRMVFCAGVNIQMLYSGGAVCAFGSARRVGGAGHDARRIDRRVEQAALRPAHEDAARAVPQREAGLEAAAGRGAGNRAHVVQRRRRLRGPGHAGVREQRLGVLDEVVGVDDGEVAAEIDVGALARQHHEAAVAHLARAHELDAACSTPATGVPVRCETAP